MRRIIIGIILIALVITFIPLRVNAEHIWGPDEMDTTFGAYFRFRYESWDNLFDFNDELPPHDTDYLDLKTSVWLKNDYAKKYGLFIKITNGSRYFLNTDDPAARPHGLNEDEIFFDNLYAYAKRIFGLPVDLTVGRQDFARDFGEGFVIVEGTPLDGSRTFYFNAARAEIKLNERNSLDLVYISNPETDVYLPSLYPSEKRQLNTSDETGFVLYGKSRISDSFALEPYYIFKSEEEPGATSGELDLNTFGGRAVYSMNTFTIRAEYAYQTGEYDGGADRTGHGGYIFVGNRFKDVRWSPKLDVGVVYLSGDDPDSSDDEGWNPLFSRWPAWSWIMAANLAPERGLGYWTNMQMYRANLSLGFSRETRLDLWYNYMRANEDTSSKAPFYSHDGKERGHLAQARVSHTFSEKIDGYFHIEYMIPGNYYRHDDPAMFVRLQLQFKI